MPNQANTVDTLLAALKELTLWRHFETVASAEQQATVKKLLDHADALLTRVVETFPTYTLHDRTHAINVAYLMGKLAEPWINEMNALETGLLLLSAFWHDVGMVFTEDERVTIAGTEEFQDFLRTNPEARLEVAEHGEPSRAVTEWFCRWRHADRVFHHLNEVEDRLVWDGLPLRQQLGNLCRSHNLDVAALTHDDLCPTYFQGVADVRFCAVLLRLADILDFDRTRSPEAIYRHLGIGRRTDSRDKASTVEWRKHLGSKGFEFPKPKQRRAPYSVTFVAAPAEPVVEWDVRQFLDVIEGELLACQQIVYTCSPRWRNTVVPTRVNRQLYSEHYKFGDYRFLLEQEQVLELLMGENLYNNPYVFVRELLQNALDTSRHREFHEQAKGQATFRCEPIVVSEWYDHEQYHWVRFDDFGMGMTEEIIRNFLLRVGRSYYTSAEFKAEQLQYLAQNGFTPISRFGIGLLSCFIAGDRVEIATRHAIHAKSQADSIRLSLSGLHGFFTLQTQNHIPAPMPTPNGDEPGYRRLSGTSIAVRLDPRRERSLLNVSQALKQYLSYPPVPVHFERSPVGGDWALTRTPLIDHISEEVIDGKRIDVFASKLAFDPSVSIRIRVLPLDFTFHSPTDKLSGQMVMLRVDTESNLDEIEDQLGIERDFEFSISKNGLTLSSRLRGFYFLKTRKHKKRLSQRALAHREFVKRTMNPDGDGGEASINLDKFWRELSPTVRSLLLAERPLISLSHNGISVETEQVIEEEFPQEIYGNVKRIFRGYDGGVRLFGFILLSDALRPELSVSRESLRYLPWNVCLALELAFRAALQNHGLEMDALMVNGFLSEEELLLSDVANELLLDNEGPWSNESIFQLKRLESTSRASTTICAKELKERLQRGGGHIHLARRISAPYFDILDLVQRVFLQRDFLCVLDIREQVVIVTGIRNSPLLPGEFLFPPLTFLPFEGSEVLRYSESDFINSRHDFAKWLLATSPQLAEKFPGFLTSIRGMLGRFLYDDSDLEEREMEKRKWLEEVNQILDRLREVAPSLGPPSRLSLSHVDIGMPTPGN